MSFPSPARILCKADSSGFDCLVFKETKHLLKYLWDSVGEEEHHLLEAYRIN